MQETAQHAELVEAEINGLRGRMILDTGAYLAAIDINLAQQIKARPLVTRAGFHRPLSTDEFEHVTRMDRHYLEVKDLVENQPLTYLQSFSLGGVPVRAPNIRLRRFASSLGASVIGSLGMDILGSNGAIVDFGQQKLYFYPATAAR